MNIRLLEPDVLLALLPPAPQLQRELAALRQTVDAADPAHLILDCGQVEVITSVSIGALLLLRRQQIERNTRLILCRLNLATRCIFRVVALDSVLCYAADRAEAVRMIRSGRETPENVAIAMR